MKSGGNLGKLTLLSILVIVIGIFLIPQKCLAVGLGIYFPALGRGSSTVEWSQGGESVDFHPSVNHFGYGFVFDTRVENPGIFNYRLNLGYDKANFTEEGETYDYDLSCYSINNTFGFAVLQTELVRLWLGPQLSLLYMTYSEDYPDGDVQVNLFGIGFAPVLGANFNFGRLISVCPELGYHFSFLEGNSIRDWDGVIDSFEIDWNMRTSEYFMRLNIIFRVNDYFF